jgi:predicted alpha/beta superfamily hydrolase
MSLSVALGGDDMKAVLSLLFCMLTLASPAAAQEQAPQESQGRPQSGYLVQPSLLMRGENLPWDHEIRIALPSEYFKKPESRYPVLWVTDGHGLFDGALATSGMSGLSQRFIVVSIGAPKGTDGSEAGKRRIFDFYPEQNWTDGNPELAQIMLTRGLGKSGGGSAFLAFLTGPLRQQISSKYRASDDHVLFGFSSGGAFCAYALFGSPKAFRSYICASGPLHHGNDFQFKAEQEYARTHTDLPANLFLSAGEHEAIGQLGEEPLAASHILSSNALLAERLALRNYPSLKLDFMVVPGEAHTGWGLTQSLRHALRELYLTEKDRARGTSLFTYRRPIRRR